MAVRPSETNVISHIRREFIKWIQTIGAGGAQTRVGTGRGRGGSSSTTNVREYINERARGLMEDLVKAYSCNNLGELLRRVNDNITEVKESLKSLGYEELIDSTYITISRLVVGLRNPYMEVLETGIAWDPYWNLPYIPSSSLKGAINSAAQGTPCSRALSPTDEEGNPAEVSPIVVLDSYPVYCPANGGLLTLDIINPHYREGEGAISEPQVNPTPIPFLAISKGVGFRVVVMINRSRLRYKCGGRDVGEYVYMDSKCQGACMVKEISDIVMKALNNGLGAKTALGYGRMIRQKP
ncbi:type III-B CRISPR module RAMP protein Cmr6 [Vulcanisaeta distributa]|uniref:CRISPR-associated RAMP protein, Cmr6 family n=1 Tax=Vulcanisaeta distributa (strain DSM 14429 / JCM 11212 / NBRC 100878 / IC-017) TaxID=572478 RepID=E1QQX7_VULDI|nr:type III-B CRISPR module RAMP protein Cmr6 [Vulcanisaeta distributa]ADN50547.1 CRISPR-associated RAMP protein, Cmr6 family [Vulcanisaeta distributa DSM 14429]